MYVYCYNSDGIPLRVLFNSCVRSDGHTFRFCSLLHCIRDDRLVALPRHRRSRIVASRWAKCPDTSTCICLETLRTFRDKRNRLSECVVFPLGPCTSLGSSPLLCWNLLKRDSHPLRNSVNVPVMQSNDTVARWTIQFFNESYAFSGTIHMVRTCGK